MNGPDVTISDGDITDLEAVMRVMVDSFDRVWNLAQEKHVTLRTAAYIIGIGRVGRATVLGGI